jgi:hypothetical protein
MLNPTQHTLREAAIQAAATAKNLPSFSQAYTPNPTQAEYNAKAMSKACNHLARTTNMCNNGLVKQLCFIQANNKLAVLSCPFPTQAPDGEAIIAGSLGDSFDLICPVTIRLHDASGLVISIVTPKKYAVDKLDLPTSESDPALEEEGPAPPTGTPAKPAGPDRIKIVIKNPLEKPCIAAILKVFHLAAGYSIPIEATKDPITIETPIPQTNLTEFDLWLRQ